VNPAGDGDKGVSFRRTRPAEDALDSPRVGGIEATSPQNAMQATTNRIDAIGREPTA
jgi:hypothetical protein